MSPSNLLETLPSATPGEPDMALHGHPSTTTDGVESMDRQGKNAVEEISGLFSLFFIVAAAVFIREATVAGQDHMYLMCGLVGLLLAIVSPGLVHACIALQQQTRRHEVARTPPGPSAVLRM